MGRDAWTSRDLSGEPDRETGSRCSRMAMFRGSDYFDATRVACSTAPFVDLDIAVLTASALLPATWIAC